jgi:hypothetical protein
MFKVASNLLLTALLVGGVYYIAERYYFLCDIPVQYALGNFDQRFGITQDKFLSSLRESEEIWEEAANQNLFDYNPSANFKINLNYDERQEGTLAAHRSEQNIEATRANYDILFSQYTSQKERYDHDMREYEAAKGRYTTRVEAYNQRVADINAKGGATPEEARELQEEKGDLQGEASRLESQRLDLNKRAGQLNDLGNQINDLAGQLNIKVDIHNESFGEAREFDQADYTGKDINVYQFDNPDDLRLVLAHEFGHALGIDHVENPKSIMYYLMEKQNVSHPSPSIEDIVALKKVCSL